MIDFNDFNRTVIADFRANNGRLTGPGSTTPMLLLHHVGRRSGKAYVVPLVSFTSDEGRRFIVAAKGGAPDDPEWYHNALAAGQVTVEFGDHTETVRVVELSRAERDELYATVVIRQTPGFAAYQEQTDRVIPMIELLPIA